MQSRLRVWIVAFIAAVALVFVGFISPSGASASGKMDSNAESDVLQLSEEDFGLYCLGKGALRGVVSVAPHDAYSLYCEDADGSQTPIDVTDACNYVYGDDVRKGYGREIGLIDRLADVGKGYDGWGCMLDLGAAGDVSESHLQSWCEDQWGSHVINDGDLHADDGRQYLAYRWFCANGQGIPMDQLCAHFFGSDTLDRVRNVYDKDSWECRYSKITTE